MSTLAVSPSVVTHARVGPRRPSVATACAGLVIVLALTVMLGWILHAPLLVRLHPALPAMQFNTALLLGLSATALIASSRRAHTLSVALGAVVFAMAAATMVEHLMRIDLGIDRLFIEPFLVGATGSPGRMVPRTAAALGLAGLGFVAGAWPTARAPVAGFSAFAVGALGLSGLLQHAFGAGATAVRGLTGMAITTCVGLLLLAAGQGADAWARGAHRPVWPAWLPGAAAIGALLVSALLLQTLSEAFPDQGASLALTTAAFLGAAVAVLAWASLRVVRQAQEQAAVARQALLEQGASESRIRAIFDQSSAGILELDTAGRIVGANQRFCDLVGRPLDALTRLRLQDITHPEDRAEDAANLARGAMNALPREGWTKRYLRPDGGAIWARVSGSLVEDPGGAPSHLVGVVQDITALVEVEQRLQLALTNARHGLWDWDLTTGHVFIDSQWAGIHGYRAGEIQPSVEAWARTLHPDDAPRVREALDGALASDDVVYDVDYRARRQDGTYVWVNSRGRVQQRDAGGRPLRMMGTLHDISERKAAEERIRESLRVNEVLLKEVHHRVKNNLAAMASLFYLQSQTTRDPATIALLEDSRARVHSMALVHELLYRGSDLSSVDFAEYAAALADHLIKGQSRSTRLHLTTRLDPLPLGVDRAIPCGLVLNEMLTNALKHAFKGRDEGVLAIALEVEDGVCRLSVADDGIGLEPRDAAAPPSLGVRLMRSLAGQLDGRFVLEPSPSGPGTVARLEFTV